MAIVRSLYGHCKVIIRSFYGHYKVIVWLYGHCKVTIKRTPSMSSSMVVTPPSLAVRAHTPTAWFLATVGNSSAVNRYTVAKAAAAAAAALVLKLQTNHRQSFPNHIGGLY